MNNPTVTITDGQLKGKSVRNYLGERFYCFLGIPYAKPPVDALRFKAPVPIEPWNGIRDATKEGPECPSYHMILFTYVGKEDNCLNLNVYTKELPKQEDIQLKPVMVWIHGGGFFQGSNKSELFGPDYLMTEDIVLVCINYRLGVLGFLALEDSSLGIPGNAGLKDMILALKWVQNNIHNFGGDPNNVTIFGESAGGAAVHLLYLSPLSKGLFHKAIIQSGCALNSWAKGQNNGREIFNGLGYKETDEKKILEYLKALPARKIVAAQYQSFMNLHADRIRLCGPVVEKASSEPAFLSEDPEDIMKAGNFNDVPLIMGYNSNEGILAESVQRMYPKYKLNDDMENEIPYDLKVERGSEKSKQLVTTIEKFYYGDEKPSENNTDKFYLLKTDNTFVHGIHRSMCYLKHKSKSPIYLYRMTVETSLNFYKIFATVKTPVILYLIFFTIQKLGRGVTKNLLLKAARLIPRNTLTGICHADDLGYLFKSFMSDSLEPGSIEEVSVKRFVKLWTNFAKTGNPTPECDQLLDNVQWSPVSKEKNNFLEIGEELKVGTNPDHERMQFWDSLYDNVRSKLE